MRAHSILLICVPASQSVIQSSTVSNVGSLRVLVELPTPPVAGLGTRPLPKAERSCGFDPSVPVPVWPEGVFVLVAVPGSGMDPCGRGANRDGAKTSEFERFGVTGPVGVPPSAGEPRDAPGEVVPLVVPELDPELVPPEPDVCALAEPNEIRRARVARRVLSKCFIKQELDSVAGVPRAIERFRLKVIPADPGLADPGGLEGHIKCLA